MLSYFNDILIFLFKINFFSTTEYHREAQQACSFIIPKRKCNVVSLVQCWLGSRKLSHRDLGLYPAPQLHYSCLGDSACGADMPCITAVLPPAALRWCRRLQSTLQPQNVKPWGKEDLSKSHNHIFNQSNKNSDWLFPTVAHWLERNIRFSRSVYFLVNSENWSELHILTWFQNDSFSNN